MDGEGTSGSWWCWVAGGKVRWNSLRRSLINGSSRGVLGSRLGYAFVVGMNNS